MNRVDTAQRHAALDSLWGEEEKKRIFAVQITQMQNVTRKIRRYERIIDNGDLLGENQIYNYTNLCEEMWFDPEPYLIQNKNKKEFARKLSQSVKNDETFVVMDCFPGMINYMVREGFTPYQRKVLTELDHADVIDDAMLIDDNVPF